MLALGLIGAVVGLIWLCAIIRYGGLVGGSLGVLILGVVFGYFFFHADVGPISVTADRAALGGLCALYGVYRLRRLAEPKVLAIEDVTLFAFIAYLLANVLTHPASSADVNPLSLWVFYFAAPLALYWVCRQARIQDGEVAAVFAALIGLGVYLGATAIAEKQGLSSLVFPRYITDVSYEEFLGRGRGPLLNPIGNGLFLTVSLSAGLLWWPELKLRGRLIVGMMLAVIGAGVLCTMTRSVWLGAALASVAPLLIRLGRVQQIGAIVLAVVLAAGLMMAKGANLGEFKRDKNVSAHDMAQSAKLRPLLALIAWEIAKDEPLFGCGLQRYREVSVDYINRRFTDSPIEKARGYVQHNVFLALLVETGVVGLTLFVLLLFLFARRAWRLALDASKDEWSRRIGSLFLSFLAAYLVNGMFHDLNVIMMVNQLLLLLAALVMGLSLEPARSWAPALMTRGLLSGRKEPHHA